MTPAGLLAGHQHQVGEGQADGAATYLETVALVEAFNTALDLIELFRGMVERQYQYWVTLFDGLQRAPDNLWLKALNIYLDKAHIKVCSLT